MSEAEHNEQIEEPIEGQAPEVSADEDRARRMGWVDKEEFRGPEERWVPAKDFLERGEDNPRILKERYQKLDQRYAELSGSVKQMMRQMGEMHKSQHDRSVGEVKQARDAAAVEGDTDAYRRYDSQYEDLRQKAPQVPEVQGDPEFESFQSQHGWYNDDLEKTAYADQIGPVVARKHPQMSRAQILAEVGRITEQKFPAVNERRSRASSVEGGQGSKGKGKRGFADLPSEARDAIGRFEQLGMDRKDLIKEYLSTYFGDE